VVTPGEQSDGRGGRRPRPRAPFGRAVLGLTVLTGLAVSVQVAGWLRLTQVLLQSCSRSATMAGTLAVALLGIGAGALLAGRLTDRRPDRLRVLAVLHLLLGAYTVVTPQVLRFPVRVFVALWREGQVPGLIDALGGTLAFVGLLPGMALIGALIPATMRVTTGVWSRLGRTLGRTAAAAFAGLAVGALLWGLGVWAMIGLSLTARLWAAAVVHLVLGAVLAVLGRVAARRGQTVDIEAERTVTRLRRRDRLSPRLRVVAVAGAVAAGLAAGGYRLLLAPLLAAQLEDRPTSLGLALGVALLGAAAGAWVSGRLIDYRRDRTIWVAGALTVAGWAALWAAAALPGVAAAVPALTFGVRSRPLGEALTFLATIVPVAVCLGAAWPALSRVFVKNLAHVGAHTGALAAAWCGGGTLAAVAAGAIARQHAGCQTALLGCALILSAVGAALVLVDFGLGTRPRAVCVTVIVAATASAALLQSGQVRYGSAAAAGHALVFYHESPAAAVAVARSPRRERWLIVNGRRVGGTSAAWSAPALALTHVPMMLNPSPRRVLVLGHRAGAAAAHARSLGGVNRIEIVEPLPGVLLGAVRFREVFAPTRHPTDVTYRRADPRGFVVGTPRYYDIVVANGLHPGSALGSGLYSREYLLGCSVHLTRGGLAVLRVPIEGLDLADLRTTVRTFRAVFRHAQVWWVPIQRREVMLVGSREPAGLDLERMAARLEGIRLAPALGVAGGDDPMSMAAWLVIAGPALDTFAGPGPVETESAPRLAMAVSGARWFRRDGGDGVAAILGALAEARSASRQDRLRMLSASDRRAGRPHRWSPDAVGESLARFDRSWAGVVAGHRAELAGDQQAASERYTAALAANPDDRAALFLLVRVAGRERADELLLGLSRQVESTAGARRRLAGLYRRTAHDAAAADELERAVALTPQDADLWTDLGEVRLDLGRDERASAALSRAVALDGALVRARLARGGLRMQRRAWPEAEADWRAVIDQASGERALHEAYSRLGICLLEQGATSRAVAELERARARFPDAPRVLAALGRAYEAAGRLREAVGVLAEARALAPRDGATADHLRRLRRRLATQPAYR